MRCIAGTAVCLVLTLFQAQAGETLVGVWTLRVANLQDVEISVATLQFTSDAARSCMGGNWKRVVVKSVVTKDKTFFPLSDPLSYTLNGAELTIGRNEVCDGYLHLRGKLEGGKATGSYEAFGIGGGRDLGKFSLSRVQE